MSSTMIFLRASSTILGEDSYALLESWPLLLSYRTLTFSMCNRTFSSQV
jgi:hypothetical protein